MLVKAFRYYGVPAPWGPGAFLHGVCMFSPFLHRFLVCAAVLFHKRSSSFHDRRLLFFFLNGHLLSWWGGGSRINQAYEMKRRTQGPLLFKQTFSFLRNHTNAEAKICLFLFFPWSRVWQRSSVDLKRLPRRKLITVLLAAALLQQKTSNLLLFGDWQGPQDCPPNLGGYVWAWSAIEAHLIKALGVCFSCF